MRGRGILVLFWNSYLRRYQVLKHHTHFFLKYSVLVPSPLFPPSYFQTAVLGAFLLEVLSFKSTSGLTSFSCLTPPPFLTKQVNAGSCICILPAHPFQCIPAILAILSHLGCGGRGLSFTSSICSDFLQNLENNLT